MPSKRSVPATVAIVHPEHGRLVINESDLPKWQEKSGWSVEGEEAKKPEKNDLPADPKSSDVTVKAAAEVIAAMDDVDAIKEYVVGDGRKGVIEAVEKRAEELKDDEEDEE
jgi:hypothetical protein